MITDFLGLIIATFITIIQEFLKDRIKKSWIKVLLFLLIIGGLIFSGVQIYKSKKDSVTTQKENAILNQKVDSLNMRILQIDNKSDSLLSIIDSINSYLYPFVTLARSKHPDVQDKDALDLLFNELNTVKYSIKDASIKSVGKKFVKTENGVQAQLSFELSNRNIRDKFTFEFHLPVNSKVNILDINVIESSSLFNFNSGISNDKKVAFISFDISGNKIPNLGLTLSSYSQFLLKSNYLKNDIEIK